MIRIATILLFIGASLSLFGQQALTDNIKGQWCIYSKGERIMLDPAIHELGNFDELGLSFFMRHEKYGIINEKGDIVVAEKYKSVKQIGGGYYVLLDEMKNQVLANWKDGEIQFRDVTSVNKVQESWYTMSIDSTELLINLAARKEWRLTKTDLILESDFNHLYVEFDTLRYLFDPRGNEISIIEQSPIFTKNYLLIYGASGKKIIYRHHEIPLPNDAKNIRIKEKEILFAQAGKSTIQSSIDGKIIAVLPYENVSYYNDNLLTVRNNANVGLATKTGELLIPIDYSSISIVDGLYHVRKPSGVGILDKNGQQLIPCKYNYIVAYSDFFTVHNELDFAGLISRKTGKMLLPCDYSKMVLNDTVVRGFSGDMLRILQLDSNHRIVNDIVMSNVTSLVHDHVKRETAVDERLFPLGWFIENVPQYDSAGFLVDEVPRWGLKGANDSVLISARYKQPIYVDQADYSLIANPTKQFTLNGYGPRQFTQFAVTSHRTGKRLIPEYVFSIDTLDLLSRSYSRFVSDKGRGFLLSNNSILRVDYFDEEDTKYVRYCKSKVLELLPSQKQEYDALKVYDFDLNNEQINTTKIFLERAEREYVRYNNAEWNFLDTNGKTVFSEPFEFAQPYSSETALVKKEGKWGVARADSLIIPIGCASIKRSPISDTLFIVKRTGAGMRFLDTNGRLMTNGITRFFSYKENFSQVEIDKNKKLIAADYSVISGETRFQKLLENNIFFSKENKEYTIYDQLGHQLGSVKLRPEEVWFERYVMTKTRGKFGLLSVDGDTLIPFQYKEITKRGNYIFAEDGVKNLLYDENLMLLDKLKTDDVLVDSISGSYALISDGKATTYGSDQRKTGKFSGTDFKHFHNGYLIQFGKTLSVFSSENEFNFDFQPKEMEVMGENGYLIIDSKREGHYFNKDWQEITFDEPLTRVNVVGEGLAFARCRNYSLLFGGDLAVKFKAGYKNEGEFHNGFLLLTYNREYEFVDIKGINQFERTFSEAEPFSGKYATVEEKDGWTIIDGQGHFQILPSFDKITPLSQTLFSTAAQPVYGLFDSHGNELIPTEYHQLNFLRNDIIQGRKNGEIFYFDRDGKAILLD